MGELVIRKWQCDRCEAIQDEKPKLKLPRIKLIVEREEEFYTESIAWREVCDRCNSYLESLCQQIGEEQRAAKERSGG